MSELKIPIEIEQSSSGFQLGTPQESPFERFENEQDRGNNKDKKGDSKESCLGRIREIAAGSVVALVAFTKLVGCNPLVAEPVEKTKTVLTTQASTEEEEVSKETETSVATSTSTPSPTATNTPTVTPSSTPTATPSPTATQERIQEPFFIPPGELGYNYFYFQESSGSWHESHGLQYISFVSADLEEMSVDGEYLVVRIRTIVRNQEVVLKSRVKGFNYYNEETNTTHYVTPENIDAFTDLIGKRIIPNFLYSQRQRTAEERVIMVNTCNYRGDREGGINAKILYTPICSNWDLYASLDTEGVLSKDVYANYILGQEDLNNVDMNSISPLYEIMLD
jgi:hypothetical protein